jgi:hypothetical protein
MKASVIGADRVWARYRQHSDSVTARMRDEGKVYEARRQFLTWLIPYLKHSGFCDAKVYAALYHQRLLCAHPRLRRGVRLFARR